MRELKSILEGLSKGEIGLEAAYDDISSRLYSDLKYAKIDYDRERRVGYPEVIYCENKETRHILGIVTDMLDHGEENILCTRVEKSVYEEISREIEATSYYEEARLMLINKGDLPLTESYIAIVSGGTSDYRVAEEAAITAEVFGNRVDRIYDVGVAGIHRLFKNLDRIRGAKVVIVVAGMEGALTSVVAGLVDVPVIGVPTSVGYGANLQGLAALLGMLNSCSSGVSVVNIDNGFGGGYLASMINRIGRDF